MSTARTEQPIEPPADPPPVEDDAARDRRLLLDMLSSKQAEVDGMQATITELENERGRQNWRQLTERIAQAKKDAEIWLPLTMAAIDLVGIELRDYERVREWCASGKVLAKKDGVNWLVEMNSARAFAVSRGIEPPSY